MLADRPAPSDPWPRAGGRDPLRLVVALGDPAQERRLLPDLREAGDLEVVARCLAADQLVDALRAGRADAALVAHDLHRLDEDALGAVAAAGVPLVVLAPVGEEGSWRDAGAVVLAPEADPAAVRAALALAVDGPRPSVAARAAPSAPLASPGPAAAARTALGVLAVASGHGSPGRTTVAVSLAAALGTAAATVLVDLDLAGPSVAACLDADPTRNLSMLAHAEPTSAREWDRALAQETQPLGPASPHAAVLCGVPKPEMRGAVSRRFVERLLAALRERYRYVVCDVGAELLAAELAAHRAALAGADRVLLIAAADLVGLWHARTALGLLGAHAGVPPERTSLVLNRHDRRHHHGRAEVEWALGVAAAAVVPYDHRAAQRAVAAQRPLALEPRSRAARALVDLAARVHGGQVALPADPVGPRRRLRLPAALAARWPRRAGATPREGARHGDRRPAR